MDKRTEAHLAEARKALDATEKYRPGAAPFAALIEKARIHLEIAVFIENPTKTPPQMRWRPDA